MYAPCRCKLEHAVSSAGATLAQMTVQAGHRGQVTKRLSLPQHVERAQTARPKLTNLSDGQAAVVVATEPDMQLKSAREALHKGAFTIRGDAQVAEAQLLHFEWIIKRAKRRSKELMLKKSSRRAEEMSQLLSIFPPFSRFSMYLTGGRRSTTTTDELALAARGAAPAGSVQPTQAVPHRADRHSRRTFLQDARLARENVRRSEQVEGPGRLIRHVSRRMEITDDTTIAV